MSQHSMYSRGGNGMTSGGLDGYLGPEAQDFSNLPASIENPAESTDISTPLDCEGADKDQAVCQIAKAEKGAKPTST